MRPIEQIFQALDAGGFEPKWRGDRVEARCPVHGGDDRDSLEVREGDDGRALLTCQSHRCAYPDLMAALGLSPRDGFLPKESPHRRPAQSRAASPAKRPAKPSDEPVCPVPDDAPVMPETHPKLGRPAKVWPYRDADGRVLMAVNRFDTADGKDIRPASLWRHPGGRPFWEWKTLPKPRPLYGLDRLAARPDVPVLVTEGEKSADAAGELFREHVAVTSPGGSKSAGAADWSPVAGRDVVVFPDADEPGHAYAAAVVRCARAAGARSVRVVELPAGLPAGWDVADDLSEGLTLDDLRRLVSDAPEAAAEPEPERAAEPDADDTVPQSTRALRLLLDEHDLGLAETGEAFAVPKAGPRVARMLRGSGGLRAELSARFIEVHGRVPSSSALADALLLAEGLALRGRRQALALRVARHGDAAVLDLGRPDGRAVVIRPGSWELGPLPVLFRRTELTGEMPEPVRGGSLDELRDLLNVAETSWPLVVGWLVAALLPEIPHPVAAITGEQGSGKSSAARMLVEIIDPSAAPLRTAPRDPESWATAAAGSWFVALDNISSIAPWLSDTLCRAVTGDGVVRRRLYTDSDLSVSSFRRVVLLTSIDPGALRGDLADRLLLLELERIEPRRRRTDAELRAAFEAARPAILGALLDLVAAALAELPRVRLRELPRMSDFGRVLAALDAVTGSRSLETYNASAGDLARAVLEGDAVAAAVLDAVRRWRSWSGTAGELLRTLDGVTDPDRRPRSWPQSPRALAGALRRVAPALRSAGVSVEFERRGRASRERIIHVGTVRALEVVDDVDGSDSIPSTRNCCKQEAVDGVDGVDGASFSSSLEEEREEAERERPSTVEDSRIQSSTPSTSSDVLQTSDLRMDGWKPRERPTVHIVHSQPVPTLPADPFDWTGEPKAALDRLIGGGWRTADAVAKVRAEHERRRETA